MQAEQARTGLRDIIHRRGSGQAARRQFIRLLSPKTRTRSKPSPQAYLHPGGDEGLRTGRSRPLVPALVRYRIPTLKKIRAEDVSEDEAAGAPR